MAKGCIVYFLGRRKAELTAFPSPQIDYPDVQLLHPGQHAAVPRRTILALDPRERVAGGCPLAAPPDHYPELPDLLRGGRSRGSVGSSVRDGSDTSSAYSGSDTMCQSVHSLDHDDVDLSGLMESVVDSDEDENLVENLEVSWVGFLFRGFGEEIVFERDTGRSEP